MTYVMMKAPLILAAMCLPLAGMASAADPAEDGPIATLPHGHYVCSLPGDAGGKASRPQADLDFDIGNSSSYRTKDGHGTYLLRGKWLIFTRGPMKGQRFERVGESVVRKRAPDGKDAALRCIRSGSEN